MSTKTTFKRVALVAVASLGFGVLTSVAPASAAQVTLVPTAVTAGTSAPARVGASSSTTITLTHQSLATADTGTVIVAAAITAAPTGSTVRTTTNSSTNGVSIASGTTGTASNQAYATAGKASADVARTGHTAAVTTTNFKLNFTPDVAGSYTILISTGATAYATGNPSTAIVITTVGAPTAMTVASLGGAVVGGGSTGQAFELSLKDANGNATVLGPNESILLSTTDDKVAIHDGAGVAVSSFGVNGDIAGAYYFNVKPVNTTLTTITAGAAVISLKGSGLLPATLMTNTSATKVAGSDWANGDAVAAITCTTAASCLNNTAATATAFTTGSTILANGGAGLTVSGLTSATTAKNYFVKVTTAAGDTYDSAMTVAATAAAGTANAGTATFSAPAATTTLTSSVVIDGITLTFKGATPAAYTIAVQGQASVLSATAGSNKFVALVSDQFGSAIANVSVDVAVAGRNTVTKRTLGVTDANGLVSYTLTDAGTTGTLDTVTFSATVAGSNNLGTAGSASSAATVTYGTVTVDTVTVSGGSKAETIAGSTLTSIKAGDNGPEGSAVDIKAVVKDANGNLLAGVPVTFTVDAGAIVKTAAVDYATVYTGADGSATTKVFGWISGKQTITATAGGKSSTDYLTWAANDATSARVLTATATGDIVSLKVVDRFGNAVQGVAINLSRTGAGLFGNGASTQDISTDKNGTADVRFVGSGTVVAELAATYAQAYAAAGNITTKAATAAVAGTTKGTGATLAPAGVAKVSIAIAEGSDPVAVSSQAAADAAAEATDAANAATDAANAAAEAADAATAAAQDAADAVAALSTQVSEMVDALKKQITALTNLVIKIQKKVKA
jgi:hypothetical protein